jgi:hypothetical protein
MRNTTLLIAFLTMVGINTSYGQEYYPLPEENAYWSVMECDPGCYAIIYHVNGDTLLNGTMYKKIYKYMAGQSIYDTVATLHCFMRQNVEEKRIWFIRHYLGEIAEKLGYDLSVNVGESVSLPAFDPGGYYADSLFTLYSIDSIDVGPMGELSGYRKMYWFNSSGYGLVYIEGIYEVRSTFPNFNPMGPPLYSETACLEVDGVWWLAPTYYNPPYDIHCGFYLTSIDEIEEEEFTAIYPNPTSEYLIFVTPGSLLTTGIIHIYNILGENLIELEIPATERLIRVDTKSFKDGLYLLNFHSGNLSFSTKFIVKH